MMSTPRSSALGSLMQGIRLRGSVFPKVAGVLIGVQVVLGFLILLVSGWIAYDRSLDLVKQSVELRFDLVASELEQRAFSEEGTFAFSESFIIDIRRRFPDPIYIFSADGTMLHTQSLDSAYADKTYWFQPDESAALETAISPALMDSLYTERVVVKERGGGTGTWGLAPFYNPVDGTLYGGILVKPLTHTIARDFEQTAAAYQRALFIILGAAGGIALLLGALFTARLVRPLQRMSEQVHEIGTGQYQARVNLRSQDELGRLAQAINHMAGQVEASVESLKATDQLRRELVANIGHDLRTPLAAIVGYAEEAERHFAAQHPEKSQKALVVVARQAKYLQRLVGNLFELSLFDSGPPPLHLEPIPLGELLHDAIARQTPLFEEAQMSFHADIAPDLPIVQGDGVRLLRVLDNLLSNARRYAPARTTVTLMAQHQADGVAIAVQDEGEGMPPEVLTHIFERYYRGEDARTRSKRGTGLGLAISKAIAEAHGGTLTATSVLGEGSCFTLHLPVS